MSRHLGLRTRVKRRLKRLGNRKPLPTIVTGIYDTSGAEVIGLQGNGVAVMRAGPQEPLGTLASRCAALTGARVLKTLYAAPAVKIEAIAAPIPAPAPTFDRSMPEAWRGWRAFAEEGLKP